MNGIITSLTNEERNVLIPKTLTNCVYDENGKKLSDTLDELDLNTLEELSSDEDNLLFRGEPIKGGKKEVEIGDIEPTEESIELFMDTSENDFVPFGLTKAKSYSTEEKVIGTWFGKPLYEKTFEVDFSINANSWENIGHSELKPETSVSCIGIRDNNGCYPLVCEISGGTFNVLHERTGSTIHFSKVTIQYTKTTDTTTNTPIEATQHRYDEEEKIVGTWFGKPLYERTINGSFSGSSGSWIHIGIPIGNIDTFINGFGVTVTKQTYPLIVGNDENVVSVIFSRT